jgi:hypothetical protein
VSADEERTLWSRRLRSRVRFTASMFEESGRSGIWRAIFKDHGSLIMSRAREYLIQIERLNI